MAQQELDRVKPYRAYIPSSQPEIDAMMETIGVSTTNELFPDIPVNLIDPRLNLPAPLTEMELMETAAEIAGRNRLLPSFLGAGSYRHFQPADVGVIVARNEFKTAYTPYQPEIAQGTLTVSFEYQTMMANLYGMEISNTGMYDGATSMAEAALMAVRINPRRRKIVALDSVHPNWVDVTRTYQSGKEIDLTLVDAQNVGEELKDAAALIVQSPNYFGNMEDLKFLGEKAHENGALFIVAADPISLGMYKSPGEYGADISVGEGQSLGNPPHMGGINLGIFTAKMEHMREMPGRIVGETKDNRGQTAYVLTMQAREQHIKRERATYNICTAEQLIALAATVYIATLGPRGLRGIALRNHDNAYFLRDQIASIPGFKTAFPDNEFFNEFVIKCPDDPSKINRYLLEHGIIGGKDVSDRIPNGMLLCATEITSKSQMDRLSILLAAYKGGSE